MCLFRQQQVLIGLLRISSGGAVAHEDLAVKNCPGLAIQNAFVELMAGAAGLSMIDHRMRVGMLLIADDIKSIETTLRALVVHRNGQIVTRKFGAQSDIGGIEATGASEFGVGGGYMKGRNALVLDAVVFQPRPIL